jgi:hypothetical protein
MRSTHRDYASINHMIQRLKEWMMMRSGRTAIIAGHYMLDLDEDHLEPMVAGQGSKGPIREHILYYAGGFPLRTFRIGLDLLTERKEDRIVLLVNDHFFVQGLNDEDRSEEFVRNLRKEYYRSENALPRAYHDLLESTGSTLEEIFLVHERPNANSQDLLPSRSLYFSEQALRNRFDNTTRKNLASLDGFWEEETGDSGPPALFYGRPDRDEEKLCMTHEGRCGCKGEIVELANALRQLGYEHALMLIPDECHSAVNAAARATIHGAGALTSIAVATGLGGRGERPNESSWRPTVKYYEHS